MARWDTYFTVIGQDGFPSNSLKWPRAIAIANYGSLVTPHYILGDIEKKNNFKNRSQKENFDVVRQGMRESVLTGTSILLNVPYVQVASKTGTAQVGVSKTK